MGERAVPRYSRIVAELRQRIETGELAPGDRVPSTREITRQWGVAMATASKVLAELRHEGLVSAVPGVGTVVAAPARPVRAARPAAAAARPAGPSDGPASLTLGRIVATAVAVADAEGLAAVSMRRVAADLGVAPMSLYRHVADKDDLLTRMMDGVMSEHPLPAEAPAGWREAVELAARRLWDLFRRHPWLAPALSMTRPQIIASALPYSEWMLATLVTHGLDPQSAFTAHLTLLNYARGVAVNLEAEREAEAQSGLDSEEWMDHREPELRAALDTGRFPALARLATAGYDFDLDALFEFGLQRLLDGLAALLGPAAAG
ncbi:TetR/AcrR family transcriptional regulator C-terminal domain-containing protein [Streptomyces sp. NPDC059708]|uniref:TetR/AcrR family transcriptional regulator C-terminal domain-containing protein n=1 Tax=Streptomyces sp. NPDC059708 TaxID=3346916 RepID=UPI0036CFB481